jgi:hypothetical protein
MRLAIVASALLYFLGASAALAQSDSSHHAGHSADSTRKRLLYKGLGYGSDAYVSPATVILNKGFDVFQLQSSSRDIWHFPYRASFDHAVVRAFTQAGPTVRTFGGWWRLTRVELLPLGLEFEEMNWLANYTEHLIGGGLTMRMLDEWYRAHHVPMPRLMAVATTYAASALNEMTEQPNSGPTAGGIADLVIFDVAGVALFHWDQPTRFLVERWHAADWSSQASFTFPNKELQNNGQYMTLKIPVGLGRTRFFVRGGLGAQLGATRALSGGHSVSLGLGGDTEVRNVDSTGHETIEFVPSAGVYYDRNNSLLWSATLSYLENQVTMNVYPAVIPKVPRDLGLWAVYTRHHQLRFGITHRRALGLGVGYGR